MPHLLIQYSKNLETHADMQEFCNVTAAVIADTKLYPLAGTRVRAAAQDYYNVADNHPKNAFVDMILRIGVGRSAEQKKQSGDAIMAAAEAFFKTQLADSYFTLSLELVELSEKYSWKRNPIHSRLEDK